MLIDEPIPFRKFGFSTLVAFLQTIPGIKATEKGGECYVEALPSEESAHITKLIARQKTATKKHSKINTRRPTPFRQPVLRKINVTSNPYLQYFEK